MARYTPFVTVYRKPYNRRWIAECREPGCRWTFGVDVDEQETYVREQAKAHRRKHREAVTDGNA